MPTTENNASGVSKSTLMR